MSTCLALAIGMHIATAHHNEGKLNGINPGAYVHCDYVVAGAYINSLRSPSMYVAATYPLAYRIEAVVGLVSGYSKHVSPMAMLSIRMSDNYRVSFIPTVPNARGGLHISKEIW
jgi:hypothetical protein